MIPKIIHYVWVGGNEKSEDVKRCINTWKKHLPDYEIMEWNESNFDINSNQYVKKAYEEKKWAFVSDYIRVYALYNYGGIYFDTDVLVLENLDELLNNRAFIGRECKQYTMTAVIGAEKNHPFIKDFLGLYDNITFDSNNIVTNVVRVRELLIKKYGLELSNKEQLLSEGIKVYKDRILSNPSLKSKTIHAFSASWIEKKMLLINKIDKKFRARLTNKVIIIPYRIFEILIIYPKNYIAKKVKWRKNKSERQKI